jgi:hypothetical protein
MMLLLMIQGKNAGLRAKPAHMVGHLPVAGLRVGLVVSILYRNSTTNQKSVGELAGPVARSRIREARSGRREANWGGLDDRWRMMHRWVPGARNRVFVGLRGECRELARCGPGGDGGYV